MSTRFDISDVAESVPFDNDTNGFAAEDVQEAIEEVDSKITGKPRAIVIFGYKGVANVGRWLETFDGVPSNTTPFVAAETLKVRSVSIACQNIVTVTVGLYKNGVLVDSYPLVLTDKYTEANLNLDVAVDDELSMGVTFGSASEIVAFVKLEIQL